MATTPGTTPGAAPSVANVNVGVLGHVDSGKTSLVRALSTRLSTAALDKHPQSQERGITLDLGFSSFQLPADGGAGGLQVTLVDCPGHASLFKAILGGVAIVDLALLVVDVRKGLQPQAIESLVVGALAVGDRLVVALTKTDLLSDEETQRERRIAEATREIRVFLQRHLPSFASGRQLRYDAVPIVPVALVPPANNEGIGGASDALTGVAELVATLRRSLQAPTRDASGPFSLAIDHCFAIPGNGTVLTGTVLSGSLAIGQEIELPDLGVVKKVKGIQVFKQPVQSCRQGDRVGVRVNGLDPSAVERGVAIAPDSMARVSQVVIAVKQIPLFESVSKSGGKFHATVGHTTVIAVATFFSRLGGGRESELDDAFSATDMHEYVEQVDPVKKEPSDHEEPRSIARNLFALLQFEQDVFCPPNALVVCSRLDLDPKKHHCRLAFYGHVGVIVSLNGEENAQAIHTSNERVMLSNAPTGDGYAEVAQPAMERVPLSDLVVGRVKSRGGAVDKVVAPRGEAARPSEVIGRDMFAKDVDWNVYVGTVVLLKTSRLLGKIAGPFGKAGKFRIDLLDSSNEAKTPVAGEKLVMRFLKPLTIKPPRQKGKRAATDKKKGNGSSAQSATASVAQRSRLLQKAELLYPEAYLPHEAASENVAAGGDSVMPTTASQSETPESAENGDAAKEATPDQNQRTGTIERLKGETTADGRNPFVIVTGLFDNEHDALAAVGRRVTTQTSPSDPEEVGKIEKSFGKAGKVRVEFRANGGTLAQVGATVRLI